MSRLICGLIAIVLAVGSGCRTQNSGVSSEREAERRTVVARYVQTGITIDGDLTDWAGQEAEFVLLPGKPAGSRE